MKKPGVASAVPAIWLLILAGCGAADDAGIKAVDAGAAVELVPTSSAILETCAAELGATFCASADALAAAQACIARLTPDQRAGCDAVLGCLVDYAPARAGACVSGPTYASLAACATPVADNCAFYRACLEPAHPCGAAGYALGFGEPLCYLFIDHRSDFTPAGQLWLQGVRTCLQRALSVEMATPVTSCDALADTAFASHTSCYTQADNSFCQLSETDVAALEALVVPYLDNPRVGAQISAVAAICAAKAP